MRNMFKGDEVYEFTDYLLKKLKFQLEETRIYALFKDYFQDSFETEVLKFFDERFVGKELEEVEWYFKFQISGKKKKRWAQRAIQDYESKTDLKPKELLRYYLEVTKTVQESKRLGIDLMTEDDIEKAVQKKIDEITHWEKSDKPLTMYPFFLEKTKRQIKQAIMDDIALTLIQMLKQEWDSDNPSINASKDVRDYPIDKQILFDNRVHRKGIEYDGELDVEGELLPYKQLGPEPDSANLIVKDTKALRDMIEKLDISNTIKDLDYFDREIISSVLEYRSESFAMNSTINAPLRNILLDVFNNDSKQNYENLIQRLVNLTRMTFSDNDEETGNFRFFGIFDYIEFKGENNMEVEIIINKAIHDSYINKQTLRIYREQLNMLEKPMHSFLLYIQKERIMAQKSGKTVGEITVNRFQNNLRFKSRQKKRVRDEIIAALNQLIEQNLLVESYTHGTDLFLIQFIPMNNDEVRDIVNTGSNFEDSGIAGLLPSSND